MRITTDKIPRLTVIVPVYKTEPYLRRCLDSVLAQTMTDFEMILVDDGSPDNCPAICDEYAEKDERIRVIHKENGGLGHVRKVGVDLANGEYIAFVDSDDWIEPEMYEVLCGTALDESCDIVICDWKDHIAETNTTVRHSQSQTLTNNHIYDRPEIEKDILSKVILEEIHSYSWNKLYRGEILKQCNLDRGVGLENNQDWVLNCEYFKRVRRMTYVDKCLYNYAIHSGNALLGKHKDYLSIILYLHDYRMTCLKDYNMDGTNEIRLGCVRRFMNMALFAAFNYQFLFSHTTFREKLRGISATVNDPEVRRNLIDFREVIGSRDMMSKTKLVLFRLRMPLLIYGFVKCINIVRRVKCAVTGIRH